MLQGLLITPPPPPQKKKKKKLAHLAYLGQMHVLDWRSDWFVGIFAYLVIFFSRTSISSYYLARYKCYISGYLRY